MTARSSPNYSSRAGQPDLVSKAEIASAELTAVARTILEAVGWAINPRSDSSLFGNLLDYRPLPEVYTHPHTHSRTNTFTRAHTRARTCKSTHIYTKGITGSSVLRLLNYQESSSSSTTSSVSSISSAGLQEHVDRGLVSIILSNQPGLQLFDQV